jgi:ADP-ribose pyrophosphatase YjhB (NUDIX family)
MRDDFHVWCLPSGGVEFGEPVADAALRETREETGLDIRLTRLVGVYSRIGAIPDIHAVHFSAVAIGGELRTQAGETLDVQYFPVDDLPSEMIFGHKRRILDSLVESSEGKVVIHRFRNSENGPISREELYLLRDESGMSRSNFYMSYLAERWIGDEEFHLLS